MRRKLVLTPDLVALVERKVPQDHLPPDPGRVPMTDADYAEAVSSIIAQHGPGSIWVFAYGSLLWNPGFAFSERRNATLRGWHRAFCMLLSRFRGSPEQPGAAFGGVYMEIVRNIPLLLQIFIWYALVLKPLPGPKQAISLFESIFISNRGIIMPHPSFGSGAWLAVALFIGALVGTWVFRRMARARKEATGRDVPVWLISLAALFLAPVVGLLIAGWPLTWSYPVLAGFNFKGGMTLVPEFVALLLALSTYTAAFIAEIVRSGITSVSRGQTEAASALGLDSGKTLRLIVIPQALRVIIPPLTSHYLNLTKNSSLAVAIGYPDLMYAGGTVNNQSGKAIEVFSILLVVYLSVSILTSLFMNWLNARMKLVER